MVALGEVTRPWRNGTYYPNRPYKGVVLHNNQAAAPGSTYTSLGGWQRMIGRNGTVYRDVPDDTCAWHVEATGYTPKAKANTRWRPSWLVDTPGKGVSAANYSALGIELEGYDQKYTDWQYAALNRVLWDWNFRLGSLPVVTHQQLQYDRTDPVRFDYQRAFGEPYLEEHSYHGPVADPLSRVVLWPLKGLDWRNPLQGGYNFLDWTDSGHTPHPGVDLNVGANCNDDLGIPIVCPRPGIMRAVKYDDQTARSYGWHCWIEFDTGEWGHFCHMQDGGSPLVGSQLATGSVIGRCGFTKGWPCAHTHWEMRWTKPPDWSYWPYDQSREQVAKDYIDPFTWILVRGLTGWEPGNMARLNDRELYNVINNGWQQLVSPGVPCDQGSAHYKMIVDRVRDEGVCPLPYGAEFDHGNTEDGKKYTSQWWQDGTMSVWVDGMEKAERNG